MPTTSAFTAAAVARLPVAALVIEGHVELLRKTWRDNDSLSVAPFAMSTE
jgi:hypothetical protein